MIQILIGAEDIERKEHSGQAWTWKGGKVLVELETKDFEEWIKNNLKKLDATCVAFTGSASNIVAGNEILGYYLKQEELI